ncbi:3-deoxy-D-manno-octulosonic acid transferase [Psychroflexus sp. CAK1W]|uniref:3-deoxy-D-manno-octulosonic acid transferase n=1 Tax=Psychroflexus curvus TaxID=2873595 RepID=UPI001CCE5CB1|nr:glycosyltransferase N-terminal domain-containing protein [Psychroflexus curvus]MBZ9628628.1 3-deoxy-D-manno-octulosonic acid transferase [Psychroflexus curvus]
MKLFVEGRANWKGKLQSQVSEDDKVIWFHAASLGEYEQAVPVIQALKQTHPDYKIAVSFFSPSGYEIKKKDSKLDIVTYLPLDTKKNARRFLDILNPEAAFFVKYEIWPNLMDVLNNRQVKSYLISGLFRPEQLYFRPMGKFMAKALGKFDHLFVQNEESLKLLKNHGFEQASISGDTRYDRVIAQLGMDNKLSFMDDFTASGELTMVFGSTWPEDLTITLDAMNKAPAQVKLVIAPHQINAAQIQKLKKDIRKKVICYSEIENQNLQNYEVLIIDTIGLLTKIYSYANMAYVGGGMGLSGLHNILEPAAFGIPIVIGENYDKFPEAKMLRRLGGVFSVDSEKEFEGLFKKLVTDKTFREKSGQICGHFVNSEAGATQKIISSIDL